MGYPWYWTNCWTIYATPVYTTYAHYSPAVWAPTIPPWTPPPPPPLPSSPPAKAKFHPKKKEKKAKGCCLFACCRPCLDSDDEHDEGGAWPWRYECGPVPPPATSFPPHWEGKPPPKAIRFPGKDAAYAWLALDFPCAPFTDSIRVSAGNEVRATFTSAEACFWVRCASALGEGDVVRGMLDALERLGGGHGGGRGLEVVRAYWRGLEVGKRAEKGWVDGCLVYAVWKKFEGDEGLRALLVGTAGRVLVDEGRGKEGIEEVLRQGNAVGEVVMRVREGIEAQGRGWW